MNELALYAGSGGGILGGLLLGWRSVCYVEHERYCAEILANRIKDGCLHEAPIWDNVTTFDGKPWRGKVHIVTGGFPCQPWSVAGQQKGEKDHRNLWPDTSRIIGEVRPKFALLENVPGLLRQEYFGTILADFHKLGYGVIWDVVPASGVGAPHKRNRVWILAFRNWDGVPESGLAPDGWEIKDEPWGTVMYPTKTVVESIKQWAGQDTPHYQRNETSGSVPNSRSLRCDTGGAGESLQGSRTPGETRAPGREVADPLFDGRTESRESGRPNRLGTETATESQAGNQPPSTVEHCSEAIGRKELGNTDGFVMEKPRESEDSSLQKDGSQSPPVSGSSTRRNFWWEIDPANLPDMADPNSTRPRVRRAKSNGQSPGGGNEEYRPATSESGQTERRTDDLPNTQDNGINRGVRHQGPAEEAGGRRNNHTRGSRGDERRDIVRNVPDTDSVNGTVGRDDQTDAEESRIGGDFKGRSRSDDRGVIGTESNETDAEVPNPNSEQLRPGIVGQDIGSNGRDDTGRGREMANPGLSELTGRNDDPEDNPGVTGTPGSQPASCCGRGTGTEGTMANPQSCQCGAGPCQCNQTGDGRTFPSDESGDFTDPTENWPVESRVGRVVNGMACRVDRLKATGNGQVPAVARVAWEALIWKAVAYGGLILNPPPINND